MARPSPELSLICCVNRWDVFENCVLRSLDRGGALGRVEVIPIENTANQYSAPQALNRGLDQARAPVAVCCHQDVRLPGGWLDRFLGQVAAVERIDPRWGVTGVMGVAFGGAFAGHVRDPHTQRPFGRLPQEVQSLDEVFLSLRRDGSLRFDEALGGFHFYGADLCLQARTQGLRCYAVDAPVEHLSAGQSDELFYEVAERLRKKWLTIAHSPRVIETTCGVFPLRAGVPASWLTWLLTRRRTFWRRWQKRVHE